MTDQKITRQYGLWDSPITPVSLARGISFSGLAWDQDGTLVWLEGRADRGVLMVQSAGGQAPRELNSEFSTRARVGYGGGDFTVGHGQVYFVEVASGRLYRQPHSTGVARPVTPAFGYAASPALSPNGRWLLYVHTYEDQDSLALVDAAGQYWPVRLVSGDDFYMQPAWHPDGRHIAWIAWDFPNMPWDGTFLRVGTLSTVSEDAPGLPALEQVATIAGRENTSIFQPEFSPDGRFLVYISDITGWWQLYTYDLESGEHRQLTFVEAEHGIPAWVQGTRTYGFSPDSRRLIFIRSQEGSNSLWQVELEAGAETRLPLENIYSSLDGIALSPRGQEVALLASGAKQPARVIRLHLPGGSSVSRIQVLRRAAAEDLPAEAYSQPEPQSWTGHDGETVYGLFYPPHNPTFTGIGLPPLVVSIHGGPTSQARTTFNPRAQFFTSQGYAYLDVNYRGSTGYGRAYRDKLRGNWGIYDVQDAVSGARALVDSGAVDGSKMVIIGGSAGGYTVLQALVDFPGFFKAGICLYGISNQFTAATETHKFEARYSDLLLGPLPEAAEIYHQRSPINFADKIQDPIAFFQGEEDMVVPRNQSDAMVASLQRRGVPHIYHVYPGEGHGFRKAENIEDLYKTIEAFLKQYVIFT